MTTINRNSSNQRGCHAALGYARVSTDEQAREGVSLDAQRSRIRAYCEAKDLELVDMLTGDGISGKTLERPALRELVQRCERGEVVPVSDWERDHFGHVRVLEQDKPSTTALFARIPCAQ